MLTAHNKICLFFIVFVPFNSFLYIKKYPIKTDDIITRNYEADIINQKYDFIHEIIQEVLVNKEEKCDSCECDDTSNELHRNSFWHFNLNIR